MNRLKELRLEHGFKNQKVLADLLYVNQTAVSQWERGVTIPSGPMLIKLSELYGVSIDYLLGRDEKKEPAPIPEDRPVHPPEYEFLNPTNKAIADRLIADLVKSQQPTTPVKLYIAAEDGSRIETEMDMPPGFKLPNSVQILPDEYKGKTGDKASAPEER